MSARTKRILQLVKHITENERNDNLTQDQKAEQELPHKKHLERKEDARKCRDNDKHVAQENSDVLDFNFDLQSVVSTPKGPAVVFNFKNEIKCSMANPPFCNKNSKETRDSTKKKEQPEKTYQNSLSITNAKYADLAKMCKDGTIPAIHHHFYRGLKPNANKKERLPEPNFDEE
ncbi:unnamed protein product [Psylliodes chrysocephalus]|uniref:Uncharacterized protein n=1 Tax=Psylliodes chrysocephalus TaxID=3402493 RepID=A0A9P0CV39_9CUCU|nr:unnamed protein product [Psylliodes chrysocephala]